ncbi:MAG: hypothetical protein JST00_22820 [Deltaproteobacteria bacterium]|nr:hypothetical protein [Deltaproteobacteria bacterium]
MLSPLVRARTWDDYPISSYPMFARGDLGRVVSLSHAAFVLRSGAREPVPPRFFGTSEPMPALWVIDGAIGRGEARALCTSVLQRATRERVHDGAVVAVEILTSTFDTHAYFRESPDRALRERQLHARCEGSP